MTPAIGDDVAYREVHGGRVWRIGAARLIARENGFDVLWHPDRTPVLRPFAAGRELRIPGPIDWTLESRPSAGGGVGFVREGARHSLWLVFENGVFDSWYVNFEREGRWNGRCYDFVDEKLDFVVSPAGAVRWKDEDELALAAAAGHLDAGEVLAEAARVLEAPPWPTGWEDFRADLGWPAPAFPEGWDVVG